MCADLCDQQERMEQTWVDNARLVQLLASVGEYQDLVTEMQDGKGLVHMPPSSKIDRYQRLSRRYGCCKDKTQSVNTKTEADQWIPAEALDMMMAFWKQHCASIPILTIQELLADLSFFWRDRERRRLAQMKTFHGKHVMELKRQLTHRQPYGQVVTKAMKPLRIPSQISRRFQASPSHEHTCVWGGYQLSKKKKRNFFGGRLLY
ncbi:unnamed protein product [Sphagnum troendelagicum]|uniref:Uncharacterized protein n=1 Tax=Sphagnum troendelagicum TaxID=128251 RepID=A0ABP0UC41_9BRYO